MATMTLTQSLSLCTEQKQCSGDNNQLRVYHRVDRIVRGPEPLAHGHGQRACPVSRSQKQDYTQIIRAVNSEDVPTETRCLIVSWLGAVSHRSATYTTSSSSTLTSSLYAFVLDKQLIIGLFEHECEWCGLIATSGNALRILRNLTPVYSFNNVRALENT